MNLSFIAVGTNRCNEVHWYIRKTETHGDWLWFTDLRVALQSYLLLGISRWSSGLMFHLTFTDLIVLWGGAGVLLTSEVTHLWPWSWQKHSASQTRLKNTAHICGISHIRQTHLSVTSSDGGCSPVYLPSSALLCAAPRTAVIFTLYSFLRSNPVMTALGSDLLTISSRSSPDEQKTHAEMWDRTRLWEKMLGELFKFYYPFKTH